MSGWAGARARKEKWCNGPQDQRASEGEQGERAHQVNMRRPDLVWSSA